MLAIRETLAAARPDIIREVFRLFRASKAAAGLLQPEEGLDPLRFGVEANRRSLETIIAYAVKQKLIPHLVTVDDLFTDAARRLV